MNQWLPLMLLGVSVICSFSAHAARAEDGEATAAWSYEEAVHLLGTWIESVLDYERLPGASVVVVQDQEIVYAEGFGHADVAHGIEATSGTAYSICSITKLFTSIALMQLRDAGRVDLDQPVSAYLPWFSMQTPAADTRQPTLRELLSHTGGLPCEPDHTVWEDRASLYPSHDELVERVTSLRASYPTGTEFNYSNVGYAVLGEVVAAVSGMEYGNYLRQNILDPLGMTMTVLGTPEVVPSSEVATGYGRWSRAGDRVRIPAAAPQSLAPAWGLSSTARDLARFAMWQFRVLDGEDTSVLRRETLEEMQTKQWSNPGWGLGFSIWNMEDTVFFGHQGGCPGYKSQLILCPETRIAVIVMVNATDAPQFTLAFRTYEIMAPVLTSAGARATESLDWTPYTGYYTAVKT